MRPAVFAAALLGVLAIAPTALAQQRKMERVSIEHLRHNASPLERPFHDTILKRPVRLTAFDNSAVYTTPDGYQIRVYVTNLYSWDPAANQDLVNFFSSILHGPELSRLTIFVKTPAEMQQICGGQAAACYSPAQQSMIIAGETIGGIPPEEVITHEYGHHVASNRNNAPFDAGDWGPKYWATVMNICANVRAGALFPGDEGANYQRNPGEGWAEAFRAWNEQHLGWTSIGWIVVDPFFIPDATALAAVQADVTRPWRGASVATLSGRLRRNQARVYRISPFDGWMTARVSGNARVSFLNSGGRVVTRPGRSIRRLVCGDRRPLLIKVVGLGATRFSLRVTYADLTS